MSNTNGYILATVSSLVYAILINDFGVNYYSFFDFLSDIIITSVGALIIPFLIASAFTKKKDFWNNLGKNFGIACIIIQTTAYLGNLSY